MVYLIFKILLKLILVKLISSVWNIFSFHIVRKYLSSCFKTLKTNLEKASIWQVDVILYHILLLWDEKLIKLWCKELFLELTEEIFNTIVFASSLQSSLRSNISLQTSVNIALLLLEDLETVQLEQINKVLLPSTSSK